MKQVFNHARYMHLMAIAAALLGLDRPTQGLQYRGERQAPPRHRRKFHKGWRREQARKRVGKKAYV